MKLQTEEPYHPNASVLLQLMELQLGEVVEE